MLLAAFHDLIWRKKRFAIAMAATALVFAMSLLMSGLAASFPNEIDRMTQRLGGDLYLAPAGSNGPFYSGSFVPMATAPPAATGVMFSVGSVLAENKPVQVAIFGVEPQSFASPTVATGAALVGDGEAVISSALGRKVGDKIAISNTEFTVVGLTNGVTLFGGQSTIYMSLTSAQAMLAGGQPIASFLLAPAGTEVPSGLVAFSREQAKEDLLRPLQSAADSITFVTVLLWIVAACIIGSVVFLSAMERTRDFAVFKATGASTRAIGGGLVLQAAALAAAASLVAIGVALLMAPFFPIPVEIPTQTVVLLPLLAIGVGCVASLFGLRRAVSVPPALAFGGAS